MKWGFTLNLLRICMTHNFLTLIEVDRLRCQRVLSCHVRIRVVGRWRVPRIVLLTELLAKLPILIHVGIRLVAVIVVVIALLSVISW